MGRLNKLPQRGRALPNKQLGGTVNSTSWRKGGGATQRLYTYQWEQYRKRFLFLNPLCVRCTALGRVTEATVVDHIVPHQGNVELFWKQDNHQALCKCCHDGWKAREEHAAGHRR
ncbi:HNH endonuclease [Stenotrophomonas phage BUCT603]|nr:HNH endonuclease [Stenotrophomonas phage BUCT603]